MTTLALGRGAGCFSAGSINGGDLWRGVRNSSGENDGADSSEHKHHRVDVTAFCSDIAERETKPDHGHAISLVVTRPGICALSR